MGLGLGADNLRQFTRPAQELYKLKAVPLFSTVISRAFTVIDMCPKYIFQVLVDCCAAGRKQSSGRECSAALIARQIACNALAKLQGDPKRSLLVLCFDASNLHTPMREASVAFFPCVLNLTNVRAGLFSASVRSSYCPASGAGSASD